MTIGLRVGPFELVREATVPEPGDWYLGRRVQPARNTEAEVLVRLLRPDATEADRIDLENQFETLRAYSDAHIPSPVARFEGIAALAVVAHEGASLDRILAARKTGQLQMTPATALELCDELAVALLHVHQKGSHHGHLEPSLATVDDAGRVWLWGLGRTSPVSERWTSPEQARSQPTTAATDQWSLGAVLGALVLGVPPWRDADPLPAARRGDPSAFLGAIDTQWPALGRLLGRMMDPTPANRYPTLHHVRQELLALSRRAGGVSDLSRLSRVVGSAATDSQDVPTSGSESVPAAPIPQAPRTAEPTQEARTAEPAHQTPVAADPIGPPAPRPRRIDLPEEAMPVVGLVEEETLDLPPAPRWTEGGEGPTAVPLDEEAITEEFSDAAETDDGPAVFAVPTIPEYPASTLPSPDVTRVAPWAAAAMLLALAAYSAWHFWP